MTHPRREFIQRVLWTTFGLCAAGPSVFGAAAAGERTYTVRKGDTLSDIARREGTSIAALRTRNRLKGDLIRIGQKLVIPGGAASGLIADVAAATKRIRVDAPRWRYTVVHHSAIEDGNAAIYGRAHERRGMEHGLAYHFVIGNGRDSGDGEIEIGPRWTHQLRGGHVRNSNVNDTGVGICIVGNMENHRPTDRQHAALFALIDFLRAGQVSSQNKVTVHKWVDINHTVCPGRRFPYAELQKRYGARPRA